MKDDNGKTILSPRVSAMEVENWVRATSRMKGTTLLVELELASFYNPDPAYGYAFPSKPTLRRRTGLSLPTIKRALRAIRESGAWHIIDGRGGYGAKNYDQWNVNRYIPNIPPLPKGCRDWASAKRLVDRDKDIYPEPDWESKNEQPSNVVRQQRTDSGLASPKPSSIMDDDPPF